MTPHTTKARSFTDEFYATRIWQACEEREQRASRVELVRFWLLLLCLLSLGACALFTTPEEVDFSDSGVGCLDDCMDPAIQDEADTLVSMGRKEI